MCVWMEARSVIFAYSEIDMWKFVIICCAGQGALSGLVGEIECEYAVRHDLTVVVHDDNKPGCKMVDADESTVG